MSDTIAKEEVKRIIMEEYAYWMESMDIPGVDTIITCGALANVLVAILIHPKKVRPKEPPEMQIPRVENEEPT